MGADSTEDGPAFPVFSEGENPFGELYLIGVPGEVTITAGPQWHGGDDQHWEAGSMLRKSQHRVTLS